jgi:hypothetical protein
MRATFTHFGLGTVVLSLALMTGCTKSADDDTPAAVTTHTYSGTASVGDFLTVSLDSVAHTMHYKNTTNGQDYTVPYTVASDGTYTFADPTGNLVIGYESPGYAMVIEATKAGPGGDTPALITAIESTTVTTDVFKSKDYNYMQFRTNSGGIEVGHVTCDASGNISPNHYWPFGAFNGDSSGVFGGSTLPTVGLTANADHSALVLTTTESGVTETDYIFATTGGFLAVDTANGAIVCMQSRASANFDAATMAGSYQAILYEKTGCQTGVGNVETSTGQSIFKGTVTFSSTGLVTVVDAGGTTIVNNVQLTKFSDRSDLYGVGKVTDPCNGFFTFTTTDGAGVQQDIFVAFMDRSILMSSFVGHPAGTGSATYDYFYGLGLKTSGSASASLPATSPALALATP